MNRAPLYSVLGANAVSQVGDMMVAVAMPWFVLQTTGSVVMTGVTAAVVGVGTMISSAAGGPAVDRLGFRRASVMSDVSAGTAVVAIPLLFWVGALPFGLFLTLVLLISVLNAPGDMARRALLPLLARWAAMPLERANAADTSIPRVAMLAGPVLGGLLIAVAGAANVLVLNAATFFLSAALVAVGVPSRAAREQTREVRRRDAGGPTATQVFAHPRLLGKPARRYLSELLTGLRFIGTKRLMLSLVVVAAVANVLEKPLMSVVAPAYAESIYGSATSFGALLGAFGAGALAGTAVFGWVGNQLPRRLTFLLCLLVAPLLLFGSLAATPSLPVLLAAVAASGAFFGPMNSLFATAVQDATPPAMLGRVFGTITALSMVGIPLSAPVIGVIVARAGLVTTLLGMGAVYLLLAVTMALTPALRELDATPERRRAADGEGG